MQIHEQYTDFDKHLEMLENSDGEAFFFDVHDNPARFQQMVVDTVLAKELPEVILIFNKGCGEKKCRSIAKSANRRIITALKRRRYRTHLFIFPAALFELAESEYSRELN